jgi:hypothetical protein
MALPVIPNAQTLITSALLKAGIVGIDESIEQPILNEALNDANDMLSQWNHQRYLVYHLRNYAFVSTGAQTYTVGAGQNFDINPRPDRIESAFLRQIIPSQGQQIDWPLSIIPARENYDQIVLKTLGTFSWSIFYDSGWPIGTLYPWPIPQASIYEIHCTFKETLQRFGSLQDQLNLPPEYVAALKWNLAQWYRESYQMPESAMINKLARKTLNTIRLANVQVPELSMPYQVRKNSGVSYNYKADVP